MQAVADSIVRRLGKRSDKAVVLGSGWGNVAKMLRNPTTIKYRDIPGFLTTGVASHKGELVCGELGDKTVLMLCGRFHYYEGYEMCEITDYVEILHAIGVKTLVLTNAAGGINQSYQVGDLMVIRDHIKLTTQSPLRGKAEFVDMTHAYTPELVELALVCAKRCAVTLREGVYFYAAGPQFETPAEIRAMRVLGADAVGMSTVPETIRARACGMDVLGLSLITNLAAGMTGEALSDDEVVKVALCAQDDCAALLSAILQSI